MICSAKPASPASPRCRSPRCTCPSRTRTNIWRACRPPCARICARRCGAPSKATIEIRDTIDGIEDEIVALFEETKAHRKTDYGAFDEVPANYFREVMQRHARQGAAHAVPRRRRARDLQHLPHRAGPHHRQVRRHALSARARAQSLFRQLDGDGARCAWSAASPGCRRGTRATGRRCGSGAS